MTILIPAIAAVLLALLSLPRLQKDPRPAVTVPEPERVTAAVVEPRPSGSPTRPFAYDNGLMIGGSQ
jgi:hypothetical protein